MSSPTPDDSIWKLSASLLLLKDNLRKIEASIGDAEASAVTPGAEYSPEHYRSLAAGLCQLAAEIKAEIAAMEVTRAALLQTTSGKLSQ